MERKSLSELLDFHGKSVMVTGGCQNFGREISDGFAELGANLVVTSRDEIKAQHRAEELERQFGVRAIGIGMDVTEEASIKRAFKIAADEFGKLDALVNNAGGHGKGTTGALADEPLPVWDFYLKANLTGTFLCLKEYAKMMIPHGYGAVVNIASVTSLLGRDRRVYQDLPMTPNPIPYTTAKAGVIGLTYDSAAVLGKHGIRVNAVSPGGFERGQPEPFIQAYSERAMLGRMGKDGVDLKGAVVFLCSDAAGYITGHNLYVDGGFSRFK